MRSDTDFKRPMVDVMTRSEVPRIRIAQATDIEPVGRCARAAYQRYVARIGREPAPMVADFASQISAGLVYVIDVDGEVAGYAVAYPSYGGMHLENVAVDPSFQGRGLGRALISHVESQARAGAHDQVNLYTNAKMLENLRMYPALGYTEVDRRTEDGFERVYFEKAL